MKKTAVILAISLGLTGYVYSVCAAPPAPPPPNRPQAAPVQKPQTVKPQPQPHINRAIQAPVKAPVKAIQAPAKAIEKTGHSTSPTGTTSSKRSSSPQGNVSSDKSAAPGKVSRPQFPLKGSASSIIRSTTPGASSHPKPTFFGNVSSIRAGSGLNGIDIARHLPKSDRHFRHNSPKEASYRQANLEGLADKRLGNKFSDPTKRQSQEVYKGIKDRLGKHEAKLAETAKQGKTELTKDLSKKGKGNNVPIGNASIADVAKGVGNKVNAAAKVNFEVKYTKDPKTGKAIGAKLITDHYDITLPKSMLNTPKSDLTAFAKNAEAAYATAALALGKPNYNLGSTPVPVGKSEKNRIQVSFLAPDPNAGGWYNPSSKKISLVEQSGSKGLKDGMMAYASILSHETTHYIYDRITPDVKKASWFGKMGTPEMQRYNWLNESLAYAAGSKFDQQYGGISPKTYKFASKQSWEDTAKNYYANSNSGKNFHAEAERMRASGQLLGSLRGYSVQNGKTVYLTHEQWVSGLVDSLNANKGAGFGKNFDNVMGGGTDLRKMYSQKYEPK